MKRRRGVRSWAIVLLTAGIVAASSYAQQYVGSEVCRTCHADIAAPFFRNPHFKSLASGAAPGPTVGCEGCHGPASGHVAAGGGKETIPNAFSKLSPEKILDTCLSCHAQTISRANIRRSEHTLANIVCTNCHSVHHSPAPRNLLKTAEQRDLCYGCHTIVRAQFSMPFKHRVNEGSVKCTDCHNPHGAFATTWGMGGRPRMVDQAVGNEEPCLKCHIDKRGPFLYEHAAVRIEGCETCHISHGSTNARLLKRPVIFTVCLECHTGVGQFGRDANGIPTQTPSHNMSDPRYQNCTVCHARIHGSNADPRFFR